MNDDEVLERAAEILWAKIKNTQIKSAKDVVSFLQNKIGHAGIEKIICIYLGMKKEVLDYEILNEGTVGYSMAHPREVVKKCLDNNAAAIIIAHNHSSNDCTPSHADLEFTKDIKKVLEVFDIRFVDHIIVGPTEFKCLLT